MRSLGPLGLLALAGLAGGARGAAQGPPPASEGVITGSVWDSLSARALGGAEVSLGPAGPSARADPEGRFSLRAEPGEYAVTFVHRDVPAWSALHHARRIRLEAGKVVEVALATASAATVLGRVCPGGGVVAGGLVLDLLTLVPLPAASVDARPLGGDAGMRSVTTAADGSWFLCLAEGVGPLEVTARLGEGRSRTVRLEDASSVRARDLYVSASRPAALQGRVLDAQSGAALAGASVRVVGTRLGAVTGDDGAFTFRGVPPGTVRLAVERLGYGRSERDVLIEGGAAARVTLELLPAAVAVDSVVVTVEGGILDRDRMATRFDGLERAQIDRLLPRSLGFDDLLRNANIPGLRVRDVEYLRESGVRERGICVETARRSTLSADQCQMVEVYLNDVRVVDAELVLQALVPGSVERFQILSPTQAGIQYLGTPRARNGVLLIWTRRR